MTLTPEQLDHLTAESAEDGATFVMCSELRELVAAYKRLVDADAKTRESSADRGESATAASLADAQLDALMALEAKATPGEWERRGEQVWPAPSSPDRVFVAFCGGEGSKTGITDATFIAAARNAFPALLAMARRLLRIESTWGVKTPETWADIDPSERPRF